MDVQLSAADLQPPNLPWRDLGPQQAAGFLTVYLSDDLSPLPIRGVTLPGNNKSDPNLETGTYGLFSTCAHAMRASIVQNNLKHLFFITRRQGRRILTGYYRLRWYAPGPLKRKPPDYAIAADYLHFIHPGIGLEDLPQEIKAVVATRFRIYKRIEEPIAIILSKIMLKRPNRTEDYRREIKRLELFNQFHTGYRYAGWKQKYSFSWDFAAPYLIQANDAAETETAATSSPTDLWLCTTCGGHTRNKALLKRCPECGTMASLEPVPA